MIFVISAEYADMNRGQLLAKIHELEEVSNVSNPLIPNINIHILPTIHLLVLMLPVGRLD